MLKIQNNNTTSPQNPIKMLRADRCLEPRFAGGDTLATNPRIWLFSDRRKFPPDSIPIRMAPVRERGYCSVTGFFLFSGNGNDY
jgi:hypothetical protein